MDADDFLVDNFMDELSMDVSGDALSEYSDVLDNVVSDASNVHYFIQMPVGGNDLSGAPQMQNVYNIVTTQAPILLSNSNMTATRPTFPVVQRVQAPQPRAVIVHPQQAPIRQQIALPQPTALNKNEPGRNDEDDDHEYDDDEEEEPTKAVVKAIKQKRGRKKKDPNAPPAALSAYAFFFRETQAKVKAQNPAAKFGDVSRSVAAMWEALSEDEKSIYRSKSAEDHTRYESAMQAYKASQPVTQPPAGNEAPKAVKVVYLGGKMVATTTSAPVTVQDHQNQNHPLFQGVANMMPTMKTKPEVKPEDITENECIRHGCKNFAIRSPEWEDEYCSNDCAVRHCKNVFATFVAQNLKA